MKKTKICSLVLGTALTAALAVGLAGCGTGGITGLYPDGYKYTEPTLSAAPLSALDGWTVTGTPDGSGLVAASKPQNGGGTAYMLYDFVAQRKVAEAENPFTAVSNNTGLYLVTKPSADGAGATYEYYDKMGLVKSSNEQGTAQQGYVEFAGDELLVMGADNTAAAVTRGIAPIFTPQAFTKLKDVYLETVGSTGYVRVWNEKGKLLRTVDVDAEMNAPSGATEWKIGNSVFRQYSERLPDDAGSYDYFESYYKYDLVTKRYDYSTGKVTEYDFNAKVTGSLTTDQTGAYLVVNPIRNKREADTQELRYYGENGEVRSNVSDMIAYTGNSSTKVIPDGEYTVLKNSVETKVYRGDKQVASADGAVDFEGGYFVRTDSTSGGMSVYYNLDGSVALRETADTQAVAAANNILYYSVTADSVQTIYAYTQEGGSQSLGAGSVDGNELVMYIENADGTMNAYMIMIGFTSPFLTNLSSQLTPVSTAISGDATEGYALLSASSASGETQYYLLTATGSDLYLP